MCTETPDAESATTTRWVGPALLGGRACFRKGKKRLILVRIFNNSRLARFELRLVDPSHLPRFLFSAQTKLPGRHPF